MAEDDFADDPPSRGYEFVDESLDPELSLGQSEQAAFATPVTVYLRYDTTTLTDGGNTAPGRSSFILNVPQATLSGFQAGQAVRDQVTQCVMNGFAPYNVNVVTTEPAGSDYIMALIAGQPGDIGKNSNTGGVAPFSCSPFREGINFTFANLYYNNYGNNTALLVRKVCDTALQEIAHQFTGDHELHAPSAFSYLNYSQGKSFTDYNAPCGEYGVRDCACGRSSQNAHQLLLDKVGANANPNGGNNTPIGDPNTSLAITFPISESTLTPGFPIQVDVGNNVDHVEFKAGGATFSTDFDAPFEADTPDNFAIGEQIMVEALARDANGSLVSQANVVVEIGNENIVPGGDGNQPWGAYLPPSEVVGGCSNMRGAGLAGLIYCVGFFFWHWRRQRVD